MSSLPLHYRATRPRGLRPQLPMPQRLEWTRYNNQWGDVTLPAVTESTTLGLPAAWRAVNLIANSVASMSPLKALAADGTSELATPSLLSRPNASYGTFDFIHMAVAHALTTGNFVALKADLDPEGFARQLVPINSSLVDCHYKDGQTVYRISDIVVPAEDIFHVRGHSVPGSPWGVGAVESFRRSLGASLDLQSMASATYKTSSVPSGIISVKRPEVTEDQADAIKAKWVETYGNGKREPAVLSELFDFRPLTWSPEDSQLLQARQLDIAHIAFMFGLDPSDLGASVGGVSQTYANITDRTAQRTIDVAGPWLARFEDAFSDCLPGGQLARFRRENLTHANRKALFEEQALGITAGVLTIDEARAELNKSPLPPSDPGVAQ